MTAKCIHGEKLLNVTKIKNDTLDEQDTSELKNRTQGPNHSSVVELGLEHMIVCHKVLITVKQLTQPTHNDLQCVNLSVQVI